MAVIERRGLRAACVALLAVGASVPMRAFAQTVDGGGRGDGAAGPSAPARTEDGLLVAAGESIPGIDRIIETLDRRSPVTALAFSPDGGLVASGSEDRVVRLWRVATGRLLRRLEGHGSVVTAVAFSPDGGVIASASHDRTVRLWDARSGRLLRTLQGHVYHVYAIAFDPGGRWLVTGSWDRTLQLWNVKSGELAKKLRGHGGPIRALDVSRDGKLIASGSDDETVRLWNAESGGELATLAGQGAAVTAVRFRPDGEWLFSGTADGTVGMARLPGGSVVRKLGSCGAPVAVLAVAANGQVLGGGCGSGGAVLWDVETRTELRRTATPGTDTRALAFSPDGRMMATGADDGVIVVADLATGRPLVSLSANVSPVDAVAYARDGTLLATASRDRRVSIWRDAGEHKVLARVLAVQAGRVRGLAFSPDGGLLAAGEGRKVMLWQMGGQLGDGGARRLGSHQGAINAVAFTSDARLVSAADDATVRLWDVGGDGAAKVLKGHRGPVRALAISPDGELIASASDDATVRIWDATTGRALDVLGQYRGAITAVAFSADGKYLMTGTQERTLDVWLVAKGKLLKPMRKELAAGVVALAAHGQRIVVASADGMLGIWELAGKTPIVQSTVGPDAASALAIAPDGATIASAGRDGVVRLWDGKTLERRWSLAGSSRPRWFACNHAETCWRNDDGALLGRLDGQGERVPVSPSDDKHRTSLVARVDRGVLSGGFEVREGRTVSIPVRIENRGAHPAYWVNVAQSASHAAASTASLLLLPPPTLAVLAPGAKVNVVCEVSALGEYENPRPHVETLRLSITSASTEPASLEVPVWVETPHLKLQHLALLRGPSEAVVASMSEVTMAALEPVRLQAALKLEGRKLSGVAPVAIEQPFIGQDLALAFPLPETGSLDRSSRVTFTVRKSTHPVHVWNFPNTPVRIPPPPWLLGLIAAAALALGFVVWRARLWARARPVGRAGRRLVRLVIALAFGVGRALVAVLSLRATFRALRARLHRRSVAGTFFHLEPETQCSHLARQLGAAWSPLGGAHQPLFELGLGPEVPVNVERCLLALPTAEGQAAALAELAAEDEGPHGITAVVSESPRAELLEHLPGERRLVVFSRATMNRVLRAAQPALAFAQVVSEQVGRDDLSLFRSAVEGGQRQPFHGRRSELRRLVGEPRKNYLVIGPQGIGKTRLLDEVYRRLHANPAIECHYLSLADGDLTTALADALGMPGEGLLDVLLERLADAPKGKRVVVLCDDADAWATLDASHGGAQLQTLALLAQEHTCSFVLAGFLGLLYAARPSRGHRPFGELVKLDSLDAESCAELATVPMAALNVHYAKSSLVEHIARESAGMPSLLLAICDHVLETLPSDRSTIERADIDGACKSEAVARTVTSWRPRFGLPAPRYANLDQAVMLSAVFKTRFTLEELQDTLDSLGMKASATDVQHAAERLVAACVFEHWLGQFHFRVPLFQAVMQEATLARMIAQLSPEPSSA